MHNRLRRLFVNLTGNLFVAKFDYGRIVADYITTGTLSADRIRGGTLVLGGSNNVGGSITMRDNSGNIIGQWSNSGLTLNRGNINLDVGSSIKIPLDSGNNTYMSLGINGFKIQLENSEMSTGRMYFVNSSIYPNNKNISELTITTDSGNYRYRSNFHIGGIDAWKGRKIATNQYTNVNTARFDLEGFDIGVPNSSGPRLYFSVAQDQFFITTKSYFYKDVYFAADVQINGGSGNGMTVYIPAAIGAGGVVSSYYTCKLKSGILYSA